jgi:protein-tyrosine phosphatase
MIDIHTHILPGVDDGAKTWDETLKMVEQGVEDGIRGFVCTSHVLDRLDDAIQEVFTERFQSLEKRIRDRGLEVELWLGSELHSSAGFSLDYPVATFNGQKKYLLIEMPMGEIPRDIGEILFNLTVSGVTPIIAHPERNAQMIEQPRNAYDLLRRGALIQVNAGSLTGQFGGKVAKTARILLEHRLIHFIASDAHDANLRPMRLGKARDWVRKRYGRWEADRIFSEYPLLAVQGEPIDAPDPLPVSTGNSGGRRFFSGFRK